MFQKWKLQSEIRKCKKKIALIEKRRARSQAALVEAILTHQMPDSDDVDYFNMFTGQIEVERAKVHAYIKQLEELSK